MNTPLATASGTASGTASHSTVAGLPVLPRPSAEEFDAVIQHGAYMPLTQFGVIDATGDDAASFLHGQLTNDTQHLDAASARLAGYCSAKGRLLASFLTWRSGDTIVRAAGQGEAHRRERRTGRSRSCR
jgi:glycine cleavage system aminomethyltransferase T